LVKFQYRTSYQHGPATIDVTASHAKRSYRVHDVNVLSQSKNICTILLLLLLQVSQPCATMMESFIAFVGDGHRNIKTRDR